MADIDQAAEGWAKVREFRNHMAHVPYAARHQRELAIPLFKEIDEAYQNGELPSGLATIWQANRQALMQAGQRLIEFADQWDADFPILKTRPE